MIRFNFLCHAQRSASTIPTLSSSITKHIILKWPLLSCVREQRTKQVLATTVAKVWSRNIKLFRSAESVAMDSDFGEQRRQQMNR